MSISIRHQMQLDGYYTPSPPPPKHTIYALTTENVSKVTLADPSCMPLARYCKEMESSSYIASTPSITPRAVMESPRLIPFPYHNDSYFLPTAEHDHPGCSTTTDSSSLSSSRVGSRQFMASLTSVNNRTRLQTSSPDSSHRYTAGRVPIHETTATFEDWRRDYVNDQKNFMLKLKATLLKSSKWYKKLWNKMTPNQIKKKVSMATLKPSSHQFDSGIRKSTSCTPVWYSQFRCNPPPATHTNSILLS